MSGKAKGMRRAKPHKKKQSNLPTSQVQMDYEKSAADAVQTARDLDQYIKDRAWNDGVKFYQVEVSRPLIEGNLRVYTYMYEHKIPVFDKGGTAICYFQNKEEAKMLRDILNSEFRSTVYGKLGRHPDNYKGLFTVAYGPDHRFYGNGYE